jgi:hypothetical protein
MQDVKVDLPKEKESSQIMPPSSGRPPSNNGGGVGKSVPFTGVLNILQPCQYYYRGD